MKVFVIGAHGHIGHKVSVKLAKSGYQVVAGMRKKSEFNSLPSSDNIKAVHFDLTKSVDAMAHLFKSNHVDAVIFSAGAGGGVPPETTLAVDLDGAAKSIRAAKETNVKRYELVSAAESDNRKFWHVKFGDFPMYSYYVAKHYADLYLKNSGLNYTILHPVALSNDLGTGKVTTSKKDGNQDSISRDDVVAALVTVINDPKTFKHEYHLASGATPIKQALD